MILTRRVALNGVWLDEVDSRICISSVEPADGKENITAVDAAAGYGQRITGTHRSLVDMVVKFRILEHGHTAEGLQAREEVLEKVNAWAAGGGYMTVNYKPDRRLRVVLVQGPGAGSMWDYTKEFTLTFRAYGLPYWEQETARSAAFGGGSSYASGSVQIEGSVKTQVNIELQNRSGMLITAATVTVGGQSMIFQNLGLTGGETLVVDHTDEGLVRIRIRSAGGAYRSAMALRTTASADDFRVTPGACGVSFSATRACRITASWRARYL